jgi:hypothetical protein
MVFEREYRMAQMSRCDEVAPSHMEKAYQRAALWVTAKLPRQCRSRVKTGC